MTSLEVILRPQIHAVDLAYWLDSEEESFLIPPDVAVWSRYFCPDRRFAELVDPDQYDEGQNHTSEHYRGLVDRSRTKLENAFLEWLRSPKVPRAEKLACLGIGIKRIPRLLNSLGRYVAESTIVEHDENMWWRNHTHPLAEKKIRTIPAWRPKRRDGHFDIDMYDWSPFKTDFRATSAVKTIAQQHQRLQEFIGQFPDVLNVRYLHTVQSASPETRHLRKVIRRGVDLLSDLLGYDNARKFVSQKEPLVVQGKQVAFRLKIESVCQESSHGSIMTEVLVGDRSVCNLCVYSNDMPPLDHVASMIAHVRAGLEEDILSAGNPYGIQVQEPTGVPVLDAKLENITGRRITVRSIRPPVVGPLEPIENDDETHDLEMDVIRLGESRLLSRLTRERAHRVTGYFFQQTMSGFTVPRFRLVEVSA